jgi:NAD(P)-dependent dehydrogenase (short-subunit alcohol dehydrogenase family)
MSTAPELPDGTYVVTGGGGAIGAAVVDLLVERGAESMVVVDVAAEAARAVADRHGVEAAALDVSDPDAIDAFVASLAGRPLAGLVHAAGIFSAASFPEVSWEEWGRSLEINLAGAYRLDEKLAGAFAADGSIVHVTSVEAFHVLSSGGATTPHYAASKGGLQMLTRSLAADLGPRGVRVNAVAPGYIETPINAAVLAEGDRRAFIEDRVPLRWSLGRPEQVAGPVVFLLSRDASYVTGTTLVVDGGLTLGTIRRMDAR